MMSSHYVSSVCHRATRWQLGFFRTQMTRDVNVPGIDSAYLAMDTEEGVEVVWSEVCYSNRKLLKGSKVRSFNVYWVRLYHLVQWQQLQVVAHTVAHEYIN